MIDKWDQRFMGLASTVSGWSKDPSRKVGSVIVDSRRGVRAVGYNGFPRGADEQSDHRHARPAKYLWTEHAERNAIYDAARVGVSLTGCTIYVPWFPCMDCARAIVQAGIVRLVAIRPNLNDGQWGEQFSAANELLAEVGVVVDFMGE